jgi:hypothetical protein
MKKLFKVNIETHPGITMRDVENIVSEVMMDLNINIYRHVRCVGITEDTVDGEFIPRMETEED